MKKIVCIVGPTGVGKTALGFDIAKSNNGHLISADSVQVYQSLDIISGKDIPKNYSFHVLPQYSNKKNNAGYYSYNSSPPLYLLDVVNPFTSFTVFDFLELAHPLVEHITSQEKLPIIVGGTGLYIKALIEGIDAKSPPNHELRKKLEAKSVSELQIMLPKDKIGRMNQSDKNNKRRLMRLIEIEDNKNCELGIMNQEIDMQGKNIYESLVIGLECDREMLKERIDNRVNERLKSGALAEVEGLFQNYERLSQQVKDANGYKQLFSFLRHEITLEEAIYRWKISEYRHAKNQMTWFRKYSKVEWFDVADPKHSKKINYSLKKFLI